MADDEIAFVQAESELDLMHYASKYYDPVKAKAYYERTKKLKGREKAAEPLSKESRERQSQATAYVREQISNQRTAAQKALSKKQEARLKELQKKAEATRDAIVKKLTDLVAKLQADIEVEVPKPKLNEIPASASPSQRKFLERQNAKLMNNYNAKVRKATDKANASARKARDDARAEIKKVGDGLRTAVAKARTEYRAAKDSLTKKYQTDLKTELKNIEDKVR